ncbi:MAG: hypothetical protein GWO20_06370 [Candidatus Korarchaeota archaeon]|nr:hypothetical protein [Candidatus Korarchaeota archaeon]NIU85293.1 hypothetical protein [Candidatus Thorarchaeota archaeon]NIW15392.1 hypothetical protein [Candidatus Thorarchaeota archaeon]NIW53337.1 hypothetical protein [Candidatus Korarchaeota archaeon]
MIEAGIRFYSASNTNTITNNTITNHNYYGILLRSDSTGNCVYRNDVIDNDVNAEDTYGGNAFNSSNIGNYWGDYTGSDTDDDGIGDIPYDISGEGGSKDYLPSIERFGDPCLVVYLFYFFFCFFFPSFFDLAPLVLSYSYIFQLWQDPLIN